MNAIGTELQFKHVRGPRGTFESICLICLLSAGICRSEEELVTKENEHDCMGANGQVNPLAFRNNR